LADFASQFQNLSDFLGGAAKGVYGKIDQFTFKMLVDCLKSMDYDVVAEAIDQLVREKRELGIAPIFFVSRAHPNEMVRAKAAEALSKFDQAEEIAKLTKGKAVDEGTKALINRFGNYKGR
jgi:HEAT repeat protein